MRGFKVYLGNNTCTVLTVVIDSLILIIRVIYCILLIIDVLDWKKESVNDNIILWSRLSVLHLTNISHFKL